MTDQQTLFAEPEDTRPRLTSLTEAARTVTMTPLQAEAQRQSFALGNVAIDWDGELKTVATPSNHGGTDFDAALCRYIDAVVPGRIAGNGAAHAAPPGESDAEARAAKLQRFKDYVHSRLDAAGIPHHPPGPHGADGCRIGDRLDWLMGERTRMRDALQFYANKKTYVASVICGYSAFSLAEIDSGDKARSVLLVSKSSCAATQTQQKGEPEKDPTE